ncbi:MATH and LRR domain-containing protein PFE0570w-like [Daktulosphaira vitifoliae]|uniref:MATH and LRR domain-containing protein PFE0570w-like n=1 Tax=Daktulosphaira vitifoliae TaxID=58002 RepID=UPI0021A9DEEC|nr:MATH and LRR domain-containing protein PFE0570w-like [Daktulosphaira vitifoliae]
MSNCDPQNNRVIICDMDSSSGLIDQKCLQETGDRTFNVEWSVLSSLDSLTSKPNNSSLSDNVFKNCCANPSETLVSKEKFMVLDSDTTNMNESNFQPDDITCSTSGKTTAFQKRQKTSSYNYSFMFENIFADDDDSKMEISSNCNLNCFQKRKRILPPSDVDFNNVSKLDNTKCSSVELSIDSPQLRFSKRNKNKTSDVSNYSLTSVDNSVISNRSISINKSSMKDNSKFKKPVDVSLPISNTNNEINNSNRSQRDYCSLTRATDLILSNSLNETNHSNNKSSSWVDPYVGDSTLNNLSVSNVDQISMCSSLDIPSLNHTYDVNVNCNSTRINLSQTTKECIDLLKSQGQKNNETYTLEKSNQSETYDFGSSLLKKNNVHSDTYTVDNNKTITSFKDDVTLKKNGKFKLNKNFHDSEVFDGIINKTQGSNFGNSITFKKIDDKEKSSINNKLSKSIENNKCIELKNSSFTQTTSVTNMHNNHVIDSKNCCSSNESLFELNLSSNKNNHSHSGSFPNENINKSENFTALNKSQTKTRKKFNFASSIQTSKIHEKSSNNHVVNFSSNLILEDYLIDTNKSSENIIEKTAPESQNSIYGLSQTTVKHFTVNHSIGTQSGVFNDLIDKTVQCDSPCTSPIHLKFNHKDVLSSNSNMFNDVISNSQDLNGSKCENSCSSRSVDHISHTYDNEEKIFNKDASFKSNEKAEETLQNVSISDLSQSIVHKFVGKQCIVTQSQLFSDCINDTLDSCASQNLSKEIKFNRKNIPDNASMFDNVIGNSQDLNGSKCENSFSSRSVDHISHTYDNEEKIFNKDTSFKSNEKAEETLQNVSISDLSQSIVHKFVGKQCIVTQSQLFSDCINDTLDSCASQNLSKEIKFNRKNVSDNARMFENVIRNSQDLNDSKFVSQTEHNLLSNESIKSSPAQPNQSLISEKVNTSTSNKVNELLNHTNNLTCMLSNSEISQNITEKDHTNELQDTSRRTRSMSKRFSDTKNTNKSSMSNKTNFESEYDVLSLNNISSFSICSSKNDSYENSSCVQTSTTFNSTKNDISHNIRMTRSSKNTDEILNVSQLSSKINNTLMTNSYDKNNSFSDQSNKSKNIYTEIEESVLTDVTTGILNYDMTLNNENSRSVSKHVSIHKDNIVSETQSNVKVACLNVSASLHDFLTESSSTDVNSRIIMSKEKKESIDSPLDHISLNVRKTRSASKNKIENLNNESQLNNTENNEKSLNSLKLNNTSLCSNNSLLYRNESVRATDNDNKLTTVKEFHCNRMTRSSSKKLSGRKSMNKSHVSHNTVISYESESEILSLNNTSSFSSDSSKNYSNKNCSSHLSDVTSEILNDDLSNKIFKTKTSKSFSELSLLNKRKAIKSYSRSDHDMLKINKSFAGTTEYSKGQTQPTEFTKDFLNSESSSSKGIHNMLKYNNCSKVINSTNLSENSLKKKISKIKNDLNLTEPSVDQLKNNLIECDEYMDIDNNIPLTVSNNQITPKKSNISSALSAKTLDVDRSTISNNISSNGINTSKSRKKVFRNSSVRRSTRNTSAANKLKISFENLKLMSEKQNSKGLSDLSTSNKNVTIRSQINETFDNSSSNWLTISENTTNKTSNPYDKNSIINNRSIITQHIDNVIGIISARKSTKLHPGIFELEDRTAGVFTRSLKKQISSHSPSILTRALAMDCPSEFICSSVTVSDESILEQSGIEENITENFKTLYNKEPWVTKRLYNFLVSKLEYKYNIYSVKYAEKFVLYLASIMKEVRNEEVDMQMYSDLLKYHMAKYKIIMNTSDYLQFLTDFIPRPCYDKLIPNWDINISKVKFDSFKSFIPIMEDEEFLSTILKYLNNTML